MKNETKEKLANSHTMNLIRRIVKGNRFKSDGSKTVNGIVNLEYSHTVNLGDCLSPIIVEWMLNRQGLSLNSKAKYTAHLSAVGSVVARGIYDATIWGSGILDANSRRIIKAQSGIRKFDVRAVRGPETRDALLSAGFLCPNVYGDPVILLPKICPLPNKEVATSSSNILLIHHHKSIYLNSDEQFNGMKLFDIRTNDYNAYLNELCNTDVVISSSLHGIIIAEAYGKKAIYLADNGPVERQRVKFDDWYRSTNRMHVEPVYTIEQALNSVPPELPDLDEMSENLIMSFPYDLWA